MTWEHFLFYFVGYLWGSLEPKILPKIEKKIYNFIERRRGKNV